VAERIDMQTLRDMSLAAAPAPGDVA
jgi:hypothetical protein